MTTNYGTAAGLIAYHAARGHVVAVNDPVNTAALLVASEWLDARYRSQFPGFKTGRRTQDREWPRSSAYDIEWQPIATDEIPTEVINATYEAAQRELDAPGSLTVDFVAGETLRSLSVSGAVSLTFAGANSAFDTQLTIPVVDMILAPILTGGGEGGSALTAQGLRT